jgi:hypothetical protein
MDDEFTLCKEGDTVQRDKVSRIYTHASGEDLQSQHQPRPIMTLRRGDGPAQTALDPVGNIFLCVYTY